jgi:GH25 family lysozyme M1 (1,4-beta-N-acetylmuramidase)
MRTMGADLSHWEGEVVWSRGADYLPFAYYKATDGVDFIDSQFGNNMDGCNEFGVPHAPYHWWQELLDPISQADFFCEVTRDGKYKRYIVDVEPNGYADSVKLKRLLDRIEQNTLIRPAIYTSSYYWNMVKPTPSWAYKYDLLVAQYSYRLNPILPAGWSTWKIWQFTDYFWFDGCNATADGNWFNGTLGECRNWFGNYKPYNPLPSPDGKTKMIVSADSLYIRSGPSTSYPITGGLYKGEEIEVLDVDGYNSWVKHAKGWSAAGYYGKKYLAPKKG